VKALSVQQPFAEQIREGAKRVELRTWATKHRGPLLICAGKGGSGHGPRGVTRVVVDVVDCRPAVPGDATLVVDRTPAQLHALCSDAAARGRVLYAWVLASPRPTSPLPVVGKLGLFDVPGFGLV